MASRDKPVHVATTRRRYKGKVYETHLLRRTYREGGRVKHETVGNISHLPLPVTEMISRALKGEVFYGAEESLEIVRSLPHGHVAAVLGTIVRLGLDKILKGRKSRHKDLVVAMIVARIISPSSKLALARGLGDETFSSTLGELLGVKSAAVQELYDAMDWLLGRQARIETALAQRHLCNGSLVLYDVTSTYFEGRACPLARLGHNRDGKKSKLQIVFGLLCNAVGCPVAVEVFDGNTADPKTLAVQIQKIRSTFGLERVVLVGDRGMITEARLKEEFRQEHGLDWITALRAPAIAKLVQRGSLQVSLFDQKDMAEIVDPAYPGERLIVCRNPVLAEERARKREDLLRATEKKLDTIVEATMRRNRKLKGQDKIGLKVGKVLDHFKVGKHFQLEITDDSFRYCRNQPRIAEETALDGIYVIRTSVPEKTLSAEDTVRAYKSLSAAERAFRSLKSVDLNIRPIHHHLPDRVRAHVLLCMLAYYVEWHMRQALAPMLFEDEHTDPPTRKSPVAPARRSDKSLSKVRKKRTEEGTPVHSFQTLLSDLRTLTKNTIRFKPSDSTFDLYATPTPLQHQAFTLLAVRHRM